MALVLARVGAPLTVRFAGQLRAPDREHRFTMEFVFGGDAVGPFRFAHGGRLGNTSRCPARHEPTRRMARWQRGQSGTAPQGAAGVGRGDS